MKKELMTLTEAAQSLPNRPATPTIWRWCKQGFPLHGGRIFLEYQRIGRRLYIPREALNHFIAEATKVDREVAAEKYGKLSRRDREIAEAEQKVLR